MRSLLSDKNNQDIYGQEGSELPACSQAAACLMPPNVLPRLQSCRLVAQAERCGCCWAGAMALGPCNDRRCPFTEPEVQITA